MEWIHGVRLSDAEGVRSSAKNVLLERGVRCSLHQLLETGFMHADPHPGNLVVDANTGALTYLDFGMTVTVDARRRSAMLRGLVGFVNRDARSLVRDLVELEFLPRDVDQRGGVRLTRFSTAWRERRTRKRSRDDDFLGSCLSSARRCTRSSFGSRRTSRGFRALAALEGVATGSARVRSSTSTYVLARLVRTPTRPDPRRLVLTPDGESVRWRRVARVFRRSPVSRTGTEPFRRDAFWNRRRRARKTPCGRTLRNVSQSRRDGARRRGGRRRVIRARARAFVRRTNAKRTRKRTESDAARGGHGLPAARTRWTRYVPGGNCCAPRRPGRTRRLRRVS